MAISSISEFLQNLRRDALRRDEAGLTDGQLLDAYVRSGLHKTAQRYFPIAQWYQVVDRKGDKPALRVTAQVKAEGATKAILDVIFLDDKEEWIEHRWVAYIGAKDPKDPPVSHDWKEYTGRVAIPKSAKKTQIALQIYGPGKVWFDDVRAEYTK